MEIEKKDTKIKKDTEKVICNDRKCPFHGNLKLRGRIFRGKIIRKKQKHVTIEIQRFVYNKKYERYEKLTSKIHAYIPNCLFDKVNLGNIIEIQECRPLSKIIHFCIKKILKSEK